MMRRNEAGRKDFEGNDFEGSFFLRRELLPKGSFELFSGEGKDCEERGGKGKKRRK